jgi:hypothetical protein
MPDISKYKTEKDWLEACIPARIKEGDEQDQAVAVCMSMWRDKDKEPVSEASEPAKSKEQPAAEAPLAEAGRRLNAKQVSELRAAQATIEALLRWANYEDDEPEDVESGEAEPAEVSEAAFAESSVGHVLSLAESAMPPTERIVPLHLDVVLIQPGWGNARDNHYYNADILRRDAEIFKGVKMYESDHRAAEKSTRTWVSTVTDIAGFTDDGAPIARVSVHSRDFAERLLALNADGLLDKMECSILASGKARKGKVNGRQGHIVESITAAESVDWITRAGAGGRALSISESQEGAMPETETEQNEDIQESTFQEEAPDPTPGSLPTERVRELVEATTLPEAARTRLLAAEYAEEASLQEAIQAEVTYIKELTRSGQPFGQGRSTVTQPEPATEETRLAKFNEIMRSVGISEV